jgi:hypothetical protein
LIISKIRHSEVGFTYKVKWAMPSHATFNIKPIKEFIRKHTVPGPILDLFPLPYEFDALEFIKNLPSNSQINVRYDPIYSERQQNEMYSIKGTNYKSHPEYFMALEEEIFRITKPNAIVLKFMWNSKRIPGFENIDGLLVPHGGQHNDTICTAWRKVQNDLGAFL